MGDLGHWVKDNKELVGTFLTVLGLLVGWTLTWLAYRERNLRREEVLGWADESITALETLLLLCKLDPALTPDANVRLSNVIYATATLVERGRIFFRNKRAGSFGENKEPAYRGLRPLILDHLILAHQIACALPRADAPSKAKLGALAERTLKRFVSMAQKEVGRSRTRAVDTSQAGQTVSLARELASLPDRPARPPAAEH